MINSRIIDCYKSSPTNLTSILHISKLMSTCLETSEIKKLPLWRLAYWVECSLFMWREFFGPEARIIGIDLNPNAKKWEKDGFEIFIGNQSDRNFWAEVVKEVGNFDIILDDGGHTYEQQIVSVECLIDFVNDGGMIVVEDTHTSYMNGFGRRKYSFINYVKNKFRPD